MAKIHSFDFGRHVADILGLKNTRRIIIDIPFDDFVHVYIEEVGTDVLYDIDFSLMDGWKIVEKDTKDER